MENFVRFFVFSAFKLSFRVVRWWRGICAKVKIRREGREGAYIESQNNKLSRCKIRKKSRFSFKNLDSYFEETKKKRGNFDLSKYTQNYVSCINIMYLYLWSEWINLCQSSTKITLWYQLFPASPRLLHRNNQNVLLTSSICNLQKKERVSLTILWNLPASFRF